MLNDLGENAVPFGRLDDQRIDLRRGCTQVARTVDPGFEGAPGRRLGQDGHRIEVEGHGERCRQKRIRDEIDLAVVFGLFALYEVYCVQLRS